LCGRQDGSLQLICISLGGRRVVPGTLKPAQNAPTSAAGRSTANPGLVHLKVRDAFARADLADYGCDLAPDLRHVDPRGRVQTRDQLPQVCWHAVRAARALQRNVGFLRSFAADAHFVRRRHPEGLLRMQTGVRKVGTQLLVSVIAVACGSTDSTPRPSGLVAARVVAAAGFSWRAIDLPHRGLRLYIQQGTVAAAAPRGLTESVVRAQTDVLALLGEPLILPRPSANLPADPAALFFLGSRDDMRRLTGRPLAGFVQPGEATAFFVWAPDYRAPLRHELAHLYTFQRWGLPAGGEAATWLVEGIGVWAGGPCLGQSSDALAAGLLARGRLPSVEDLSARFRDLEENVAMPAAGSLIAFIQVREGIAGLRARWRSGPDLLLPDRALSAAWRTHVARIRPAALDIARVLQEGC